MFHFCYTVLVVTACGQLFELRQKVRFDLPGALRTCLMANPASFLLVAPVLTIGYVSHLSLALDSLE